MSSCCEQLAAYFPAKFLESTHIATENNKTFRLDIPKGIQVKDVACLLKVDGGWIDDNDRIKCDYLMVCCANKKLFLIELKGKNDHSGAIEQIIATLQTLKTKAKPLFDNNYECTGYVVAARVPKTNTGFDKLKDKVRRDHQITIKLESQQTLVKCHANQ